MAVQKKYLIEGIEFSHPLSTPSTYIKQAKLSFFQALKFKIRLILTYAKTYLKYLHTVYITKECYYGPFKGEFGNFLMHSLPFLMHLHKKNVKIHYCGIQIHAPFLVDEYKRSILYEAHWLRDFFDEVTPNTNSTIPPSDVQNEIKKFKEKAIQSKKPYWEIDNDYYYWFVHRFFILPFSKDIYNLEKAYQTRKEKSCVIFPRNKGNGYNPNNGYTWDYEEIIHQIKPFFDKIYVCGHPAQSLQITPSQKVELRITTDNSLILEACANASLIITQHSGSVYLGDYTNTDVLIIYQAPQANHPSHIRSLNNTLYFKKHFPSTRPFHYAFSMDEIMEKVKMILGR